MSKRLLAVAMVLSLPAFTDEGSSMEEIPIPMAIEQAPIVVNEQPVVSTPTPIAVEKPFSAFTGKVKKAKVRLRSGADLESRVVKEMSKNDLVAVIGEKGDFYAVEPPCGTKAYVFRSFVLDNIVEGNRVNVRLEPSLDAPIIAHLNSGDRINGSISSVHSKWYEISPPADACFYIAKEYIDYFGTPEAKLQFDKKRAAAEQLFDAAAILTKAEINKSFKEINLDRIKNSYETIINDYSEFSDLYDRAKESLAAIQEKFLQKRVAFIDNKESSEEGRSSSKEMAVQPTDRMKLWEPIEESLYLSWSSRNDDRSINEFYDEERLSGMMVAGIVEAYTLPVKNKPGDFIIRDKDLPLGYLYSTQVNLADYVDKKVTVLVTPRSNNNFAFPAYYVLSVE